MYIRKRHQYVCIVVDLAESQTIFAAAGKDGAILGQIAKDLEVLGGSRDEIAEVNIDMYPAFISGARTSSQCRKTSFVKKPSVTGSDIAQNHRWTID